MTRDLNAEISNIRIYLETLKRDVESIGARVNDFYRQLESLHLKSDMPSEFINFRASAEGRLNGLTSMVANGTEALKLAKTHLERLEKDCSNLDALMESAHSRITSMRSRQAETEVYFAADLKKHKDDTENRLQSHKEALQRQMDAFKGALSASPSSILQTNNEVVKRLDEALKGLTNVLEKTKNIDTHIAILQERVKKLEGCR